MLHLISLWHVDTKLSLWSALCVRYQNIPMGAYCAVEARDNEQSTPGMHMYLHSAERTWQTSPNIGRVTLFN